MEKLNNWWEEINKGGVVEKLFQNLDKRLRPDAYANQKYQEMIQQDPSMMLKLSDLDPTQRDAFAQALGFRDMGKSPIAGLPEGEGLKFRKQKEAYEASLTPAQRDEYFANTFGGVSNRKITREDKEEGRKDSAEGRAVDLFGQTKEMNALTIAEQKAQAREREYTQRTLDGLRIRFPAENINLEQALQDMMQNKPNTPLMQRITTDPTIAPTFKMLWEATMERIKLQAQRDIASLKSPQEKFMGLQFLQMNADNALQALNNADKAVAELGTAGMYINPVKYQQAVDAAAAAKLQHQQSSAAFQNAIKSEPAFSKYYESMKGLGGATSPASPKVQKAIDMIKSGQATIQDIDNAIKYSAEEKAAIKLALSQQGG